MRNNYSILDEKSISGEPEPFRIPPPSVECGDYITTGIFGESYSFAIRRMPRRARYTGCYGLFYDDPDAGDTLIAVLRGEEFETISPTFDFTYSNFTGPKEKVLLVKRCCWCGRKLEDGEDKIHPNCRKRCGV